MWAYVGALAYTLFLLFHCFVLEATELILYLKGRVHLMALSLLWVEGFHLGTPTSRPKKAV